MPSSGGNTGGTGGSAVRYRELLVALGSDESPPAARDPLSPPLPTLELTEPEEEAWQRTQQ